jgi:hypothetical protein
MKLRRVVPNRGLTERHNGRIIAPHRTNLAPGSRFIGQAAPDHLANATASHSELTGHLICNVPVQSLSGAIVVGVYYKRTTP